MEGVGEYSASGCKSLIRCHFGTHVPDLRGLIRLDMPEEKLAALFLGP